MQYRFGSLCWFYAQTLTAVSEVSSAIFAKSLFAIFPLAVIGMVETNK